MPHGPLGKINLMRKMMAAGTQRIMSEQLRNLIYITRPWMHYLPEANPRSQEARTSYKRAMEEGKFKEALDALEKIGSK